MRLQEASLRCCCRSWRVCVLEVCLGRLEKDFCLVAQVCHLCRESFVHGWWQWYPVGLCNGRVRWFKSGCRVTKLYILWIFCMYDFFLLFTEFTFTLCPQHTTQLSYIHRYHVFTFILLKPDSDISCTFLNLTLFDLATYHSESHIHRSSLSDLKKNHHQTQLFSQPSTPTPSVYEPPSPSAESPLGELMQASNWKDQSC